MFVIPWINADNFWGGRTLYSVNWAALSRNKLTPEGSVVSKTRIIIDAKESNVTSADFA